MPCTSRFSQIAAGGGEPPAPRADIFAPPTSIIAPPMTTLMRLGVVMDPIGAISYAKDSTLAMLLAAQAHGFELAYLEQRDLLLRDGVALERMRPLTVRADPAGWFTLGEPVLGALSSLDCLLMRKDPP